jgi:hypothetical protein
MMMFSGELVNAPFECQIPLQVGGSFYFYHRAAWDAMVWAISWGTPVIEASLMAADAAPPYHPDGVRAGSTFSVAGWAHLHLNRNVNRRLGAALSAVEQLENLPGTVPLAWEEWTIGEHLLPGRGGTSFISRVAKMLEELGSESARLARAGKLADTPSPLEDRLSGGDQDLAQFERQETLRQELDQLGGWIQNAGFAEREAQVYELDMQTDFDTDAIARELQVKPGTVRGLRKRYQDKLRKVVGSK